MKLFDVPTWAALSDWGLERFEPPVGTERLIIFGDNDANGAGQRAAYAADSRLSGRMPVEIKIPPESDSDWNDVLLSGRGS
jgi:putative DNA primase/helicase